MEIGQENPPVKNVVIQPIWSGCRYLSIVLIIIFYHLPSVHCFLNTNFSDREYDLIVITIKEFFKDKRRIKMEWKEVAYSKNNTQFPSERWGHRMVHTNTNELVLFAGFGGAPLEGRYLDDLWSFSITNCTWEQHATSGLIPQSRSNYTLHYDDINNAILLFGGSAESKARSNSLAILNWAQKEWIEQPLQANSEAPLERTYHSAEYHHPYLIIFGGEGPFGEDLDDMWVLDTQKGRWKRVIFNENGVAPRKRRFHSTALINHQFYVIGGCNESYALMNDMYRVDLQEMFENGQFSGFIWEHVYANQQILSRWGHSSLVYQQKIYIIGGKISYSGQPDNGACFDPINQTLTALPINQTISLPSRRRQASALVGNSLVIFGGFNGKYMKDFYYLALGDAPSMDYQCVAMGNRNQLLEELDKSQKKYKGDITIKLFRGKQIQFFLKSDRCRLQSHQFFVNLLKQSNQECITMELPSFCDVTAFRLVHHCLLSKEMLICPKFSIQYWNSILKIYEYLACCKQMQVFAKQMCRVVNAENCLHLLQVSTEMGLDNLKRTAAEIYCLHHEDPPRKHRQSESTIESNHQFPPFPLEDEFPNQMANLEHVYETIRFDVQQKRIKGKNGFFSKFKSAFRVQNPQAHENRQELDRRAREREPPSCLHRFFTFLAGICESSENRQSQQ